MDAWYCNFQENFLRALLEHADVELALQSGTLADLLAKRHFEPPLLKALLNQSEAAVLGAVAG